MKYNLFLDDVRVPHGCNYTKNKIYFELEWVIVRDYDQFVEYVNANGLPEVVSFDHDLADAHYDPKTWTESFVYKEKTGYDCVKWMVDYCIDKGLKFPIWYLHTMNPVGKKHMNTYILNYFKHFEPERAIRHEDGTISEKI